MLPFFFFLKCHVLIVVFACAVAHGGTSTPSAVRSGGPPSQSGIQTQPLSTTAPSAVASAQEFAQLRHELAWTRQQLDELKNERLATARSVLEQAIHLLQAHAETVEALKATKQRTVSGHTSCFFFVHPLISAFCALCAVR